LALFVTYSVLCLRSEHFLGRKSLVSFRPKIISQPTHLTWLYSVFWPIHGSLLIFT